MDKDNILKESNKELVSYLRTLPDLTQHDYETDGRGVVFFLFSPADEVEKHIADYYSKTCEGVQPKVLLDSLKEVLDIIYAVKRSKAPEAYR